MLFLLIAIISFILQLFLPWWIIAPVAFGLAFWKGRSGRHAFWSGAGAVLCSWVIMALIQSIPNENILANRVGRMLMLPDWPINWLIVLIITGVLGGLVSGLFALSGYFSQLAFLASSKKSRKKS